MKNFYSFLLFFAALLFSSQISQDLYSALISVGRYAGLEQNASPDNNGDGTEGQGEVTRKAAYCTPTASDALFYIVNFSTAGGDTNITNNVTGSGTVNKGYSDYTSLSVSVKQGSSFTVNFKGNNTDTFGWAVWIDWNKNDMFDSGERVYNTTAYTNAPATPPSINVPAGQAPGDYTLRILADFNLNNPTDPCTVSGTSKYGEAEDYTVRVVSASSCTGTPTGGTTTLSATTGAPSSAFTASVTGDTSASGITYQWEIADASGGPWTSISGATNASANLTAPATAGTTKYYRRKITCTTSGLSSTSSAVSFSTAATTYCAPTRTQVDAINNVTLTGEIAPGLVDNTGGGTNSYYVPPTGAGTPTLYPGGSYTISLNARGSSKHYLVIWIDFDNNGFTATDRVGGTVIASPTNPGTYTASIAIPANAPAGNWRMRVLWQYSTQTDVNYYNDKPCTNENFGQTRDYQVTVSCSAPGGFTAGSVTSTGAQLTWTGTGSYIVEYGSTGFTPGTGATAGTNGVIASSNATSPYNLTGLASGKPYDVYVRRKDCPTAGSFGANSAKVGFTTALAACSGTPVGGTTVLSPSTGPASSTFNATVSGDTAATGLSYQWQIADSSGGPWTDIVGATGATASLNAVSTTGTAKYYRRRVTCANGSASSNSTAVAFTTNTITYCAPTISTKNSLYINHFQFVGTLNDIPANTTGASGYSDFTSSTPVVKQPQGSVLNIVASAVGSTGAPASGYWKAWVDYDGDGTYGTTEQVYNLTSFSTESLTFGFVIPSTTPPGKYRLRLRVGGTKTFDPCDNSSTGETEDYLFEVIADCSAKINTSTLTDVSRCGTGPVTLTATGTGTGIKWYTTATGGTAIYDGSNFTTTVTENTRTTYYVVAYNATCESVFRIPVTAIANPGPTVAFSSVPAFCAASTTGQLVSASNGKRIDELLNEPFNSTLGIFQQSATEAGYLDRSATYWENRPSPYIPRATTDVPAGLYEGLAPALSSGYTGGNFVISNTDYNRAGSLLNRLTLKDNLDTRYFDDLTLEFDLYYFTLITADTDPALINYFSVEYSLDNNTWVNLQKFNSNKGNPNIWEKISIALPSAVLGKTTLKIRFSSFSYGKTGLFKESIAAIDNVKIYGTKDESSQFGWSSSTAGILYEKNCTTPLGTTKAAEICIKPTNAQLLSNIQFSITASASFTNGCPAVGKLLVNNDAKFYNTTTSTDWQTAANWKPDTAVPTADKCVIIQQPVIIGSTSNGLAKNITVEPSGTLNIKGSLKVTDWMKNMASASAVTVESDGNLVQVNEGTTINTGSITAKRDIKLSIGRQQFNYIGSPLEGQSLQSIYSGMGYVMYHSETNNYFYNSTGAYIKGRALAVQEPNSTAVAAPTVTATFTGYPTNGAFTYGIVNSNPSNLTKRGFNLISNPYPSNIDLIALYDLNGSTNLRSTFFFWDNRANNQIKQMGDGYGGQAYAQFITTTPPGVGTGVVATGDTAALKGTNAPTRFVKMGQGFMVQSKVPSYQLKLNNTIRSTDKGTVSFFGKGARDSAAVDRYWLNMVTPNNLAAQIAVVYFEGGDNGFADDDALSLGGSDAIYTLVDNEKISINGRSRFSENDAVALGTSHFVTGNYTIGLHKKEGVFETAQHIYLKDKVTGIVTDLSAGNYTFSANAGESTGRFEVVYKPGTVLATTENSENDLTVYRDAGNFVINSRVAPISDLKVYDAAGRLIHAVQPKSTKAIINADSFLPGIYLLKIEYKGRSVTKKILK